jgi:hydrogenase/urease accessory protein HupE
MSLSELKVEGREVAWTITVGRERLDATGAIPFPAPPADLTEAQLLKVKDSIAAYLGNSIALKANGRPVVAEVGRLDPVFERLMGIGEEYIGSVRQGFRFRADEDIDDLEISVSTFADLPGLHQAVVIVHWGAQRQFVKAAPAVILLSRALMDTGLWNTLAQFLLMGMHHIVIGWDHIAFLMALLLAATRATEVVKIVTSFTVAHSITLLLAAFNLVRLPAQLTECLIAASIVYVAVENYIVKDVRHRWILTFGFGLVHGLGFAEVLRERLSAAASTVVPILSFNLGVEVGQLAIVMVAWPLATLARRAPTEEAADRRRLALVRVGSGPILLFGLGWLIQRAFGLGFMPL